MSEDFLSRWSRRKREVAKVEEPAKPAKPDTQPPEHEEPAGTAKPGDPQKADEVDLSSLPSLEDITGTTDISGFLRRGVPEELTRSALRQAWSSDPAIRDFVGLSENAWDFNDPTAIPGFGPIDFSPEQVRQMAAKLVGDVREAGEKIERVVDAASHKETRVRPSDERENAKDTSLNAGTTAAARRSDAAAQNQMSDEPRTEFPRRHGGALPR